jgi:hypothetical protein
LAVALLGAAILCSAQEGRQIGGVGITVFSNPDFRGRTQTFQQDTPNLNNTGLNNNIRSLRIGRGEKWEVCDSPNYNGRCIVVSGEESDLSRNGWGNRISSFRRVRDGGGPGPGRPGRNSIVLFDRTNFRGNSTNYNAAVARLNNRAQSVRIERGSWELCDGRNFTGRCITLRSSASDLSRFNLSNGAVSARPAGSSGGGVPSNWSLVLFDRTDFRGNAAKFSAQVSNMNRNVRSVTVNGVWELCDGRNFSGRCVTLDRSVSDMGPWDVSLRISSLRPLTRGPR